MLSFKYAALVVSLLLMSELAVAGADPATDRLGLYFDTEAWIQCKDAAAGEVITAYIILTNPTFGELYGWEAAVRPKDGGLFVLSEDIAGGGVNSNAQPEFAVSYEVPIVTQPITVLATVELLSLGAPSCLILTGVGSPALPEDLPLVWPEPGAPVVVQTSHMMANGVVASLYGCAVIPEMPAPCSDAVGVEGVNWGTIKSAYR